MNVRELRQKRAGLITQARALVDKAEGENRDLLTEEDTQYKALIADATALGVRADRQEQMDDQQRDLREPANDAHRADPADGAEDPPQEGRASAAYRAAFNMFLRGGIGSLGAVEMRALQADSDVAGGYLVTPTQFVNDLLANVDNQVFVRQFATRYQVPSAESLGVPTLTADIADADWTTELATGSEDSSMAFGKRALTPHPFAKRIKISRELLRKVPDVETLVRSRLAYKFAVTEEKGFMTGTGAQQPLGLFVASNDGVPTTQDYATGNTATSMTFDGLIGAKYTLKGQYWPRARWIFHRDAMAQLAKLKDGDGQYIWRGSTVTGEPDRLLNLPYSMSEYAPNTFTANQYVGILADLSNYWIADAMNMEVQRVVELYAETNQIGLIGRQSVDGMPVLAEAFVRVKLGA